MKAILTSLCVTVLVGGLSAQTQFFISPSGHDGVDGSISTQGPFDASKSTYSWMQVHDDMPGTPMYLRSMSFRPDALIGTSGAYSVNLSIRVSTGVTTAGTASKTFAANHGADVSDVVKNVTFNLPATSSPTPGPQPFNLSFAFTNPFLYKGSRVGSLVWEMRVHSHVGSRAPQLDSADLTAPYMPFGTGGTAVGQPRSAFIPVSLMVPESGKVMTHLRYWVQGVMLSNNAPAIWMVSGNKTSFGSLKLPFSLAPLGGGANTLYVEPTITIPVTTDGGGGVNNYNAGYIVVARAPVLEGVKLYSQLVAVDKANTKFPLVFTDACMTMFPHTVKVCRIYVANSDSASTATSLHHPNGIITRFTY